MTADSSLLTSVSPHIHPTTVSKLILDRMTGGATAGSSRLHSRANSGLGLTGREALLMSEPDDDMPSCSDHDCRCKKQPVPKAATNGEGSPLRKVKINDD